MCSSMVNKNRWLLIVTMIVTAAVYAETIDENMTKPGMAEETQRTRERMQQNRDQMRQQGDQMRRQGDQMQQQHDEMMQKQHDEMAKMKQECNIAGRSGHLQSADGVIGMNVRNKQGQKLGSIQELILNDSRKSVEYALVETENKTYPVPWKALGTGKETYTLDISADNLRNAPNIQSMDSKQFKDSALRKKTDQYYGRQMKAEQEKNIGQRTMDWAEDTAAEMYTDEPAPMVYSANDIIGYEVENQQGEDIGELSDIVFDTREGNLAYGLISYGGVMGIGQKTAAVPWEAIQLESTRQIVQLQSRQTSLDNAVLENGDISRLSEPQFARDVHRNFNQQPYWVVFGFIEPMGTQDMSTAAWQSDSTYNRNFNPQTVQTMQATVKQVGSFTPEDDAAKGLKLKVETQDGKMMTVYAGPQQYYQQQQIRLQKGDQITVTGSKTTVNEKNVIIASKVKKGDQTLKLRDDQGKPAWQMQSQQSSQDMSQQQQRQQQRQRQQRQDQQMQNRDSNEEQSEMPNDTPPRYY